MHTGLNFFHKLSAVIDSLTAAIFLIMCETQFSVVELWAGMFPCISYLELYATINI